MPKFIVINYRTVITQWTDIEAENAQAAVQQVLNKSGEDGETIDDDPGDFTVQKQGGEADAYV